VSLYFFYSLLAMMFLAIHQPHCITASWLRLVDYRLLLPGTTGSRELPHCCRFRRLAPLAAAAVWFVGFPFSFSIPLRKVIHELVVKPKTPKREWYIVHSVKYTTDYYMVSFT
jgi:hypothetical protein